MENVKEIVGTMTLAFGAPLYHEKFYNIRKVRRL